MHMLIGPYLRGSNQPLQEDEVAAIFTSTDGAPAVPRDIVVYPHSNNGRLLLIPYLSPNSDPMAYPLFYPSGEPGWSLNIPRVAENAIEHRNLVTLQFYCYKWADRGIFNPFHHGSFLTQQKMADDYLKIETNRLDYIRKQQSKLRCKTFQGLRDYVHVRNRNPQPTLATPPPPSTPSAP